MNIVHIGLGKTATTTLQKYIFSELPKLDKRVEYCPKPINDLILKYHQFWLNEEEFELVKTWCMDSDSTFKLVSSEALVNWNPRLWEEAANKNLELFGKNTTIIITVRDTTSYLTSVYQQMIHEGNIRKPTEFFVNQETYNKLQNCISNINLSYFDVDSFDLSRLQKIYESRFSKVLLVPLNKINNMEFLQTALNISDSNKLYLSEKIKNIPRENRSYSAVAMRITLAREKILNFFGLQSRGSFGNWGMYLSKVQDDNQNIQKSDPTIVKNMKLLLFFLPKTLLKTIKPNYRKFMQKKFDKIIPYTKYRLPAETYVNYELLAKNDKFVKEL